MPRVPDGVAVSPFGGLTPPRIFCTLTRRKGPSRLLVAGRFSGTSGLLQRQRGKRTPRRENSRPAILD